MGVAAGEVLQMAFFDFDSRTISGRGAAGGAVRQKSTATRSDFPGINRNRVPIVHRAKRTPLFAQVKGGIGETPFFSTPVFY